MPITKDQVVTLHYTLHDGDDRFIESSQGGQPLVYLHGYDQIVPGLEDVLEGSHAGESLEVTVAPAMGYGEYDANLRQQVPVEMFGEHLPQPGMQFQAQTDAGMEVITVVEVAGDKVTIDANHPFAGRTLKFAVEVVELRDATAEEREHGHVRAAAGCGHDHAHDDDHQCCGGTGVHAEGQECCGGGGCGSKH